MTLASLFWILIVGLLVGGLLQMIIAPEARVYDPFGTVISAIIGALILGLLTPAFGIFAAPFLLMGTLIMATIGAVLAVWLIAAIVMALAAGPNEPRSANV